MKSLDRRKKTIIKRIRELDLRKNLLRIDRKIEFLLDIRGYFIINKIPGNYVEFGCYDGGMLFAALQILGPKKLNNKFIGLDTFEGEPDFTKNDTRYNTYNKKGDYTSSFVTIKRIFEKEKSKVILIKGDFRKKEIKDKFKGLMKNDKINVAVIDCNILSSIRSSLELAFRYIENGGFLFVDDFYTNMRQGQICVKDILDAVAQRFKKRLHHYKCYPPFAEAFIVVRT